MSDRPQHDLEAPPAHWEAWVRQACAELGVDASRVDVPAIHALTRTVAHEFERPLAPVSSFILGMALALRPELSVAAGVARLEELARAAGAQGQEGGR